jgi:hypothetical protein
MLRSFHQTEFSLFDIDLDQYPRGTLGLDRNHTDVSTCLRFPVQDFAGVPRRVGA